MIRLICALIGYAFGSIQTAYILGKIKGIDIREHGSGNAGTTNTLRVLGTKAGLIVFAGDMLKSIIAVLLCKALFLKTHMDIAPLITIYTGLGCVLGHNFPFYLKFKGGKGIAVTAGVCSGIDFLIIPFGIVLFGVVVLITKYVSLGSLLISFVIPFWVIVRMSEDAYYPWLIAVSCLFTISAFFMHRKNIKRLIKGEENKI